MSEISGASRYISQAMLSQKEGSTFANPTVLGELGIGGVLDASSSLLRVKGVGISSRARELNKQFLSANADRTNGLFSLTGGGSSSVDNALIQIKGIQARLPVSAINFSTALAEDDGSTAASSTTGTQVDQEV